MEINKIYNMDYLGGINFVEDGSIDLILTDPPYNISKDSNFHTMKDRENQRTGTSFGDWDNLEFDIDAFMSVAYKKLKNGGSLIIFNCFQKISDIMIGAEKNGLIYKDTLIWEKTNPMPRNRDRRYVQNIECYQWFIKGGKWTFNRHNDKYEGCVSSFPSESGGGFKRYHPTQKPIRLLEKIIKIHSNEGDLVMDTFVGSGSTAIACKINNRNFVCFELDSKYVDIANKRLEELN